MALPRQPEAELQRQRCKLCWHAAGFDFHVPDEVWEAVVTERFRNRVVCLSCFDELAAEAGVDYAPHLHPELYFAGVDGGCCFTWRLVRDDGC